MGSFSEGTEKVFNLLLVILVTVQKWKNLSLFLSFTMITQYNINRDNLKILKNIFNNTFHYFS